MPLRRDPLVNTCGREDCSSSCHRPAVTSGRYCAPFRCYCGGCPSHVPIQRGGGPIVAEWVTCSSCQGWVLELGPGGLCQDCRALRRQELTAAPPAPDPSELRTIDQAPAAVRQVRAQLAQLAEEHHGQARHRAIQEKAHRRA